MYQPTSYRYPFGPSPKGFGQVAQCPSVEQGLNIVDCSDPCQANTVNCLGTSATVLPNLQMCYNTATGAPQSCSVAGSTQTVPPSSSGPFGSPVLAGVTNLNWGLLAAVAAGLFVVAAMSGK
jgi:hypothetical protein